MRIYIVVIACVAIFSCSSTPPKPQSDRIEYRNLSAKAEIEARRQALLEKRKAILEKRQEMLRAQREQAENSTNNQSDVQAQAIEPSQPVVTEQPNETAPAHGDVKAQAVEQNAVEQQEAAQIDKMDDKSAHISEPKQDVARPITQPRLTVTIVDTQQAVDEQNVVKRTVLATSENGITQKREITYLSKEPTAKKENNNENNVDPASTTVPKATDEDSKSDADASDVEQKKSTENDTQNHIIQSELPTEAAPTPVQSGGREDNKTITIDQSRIAKKEATSPSSESKPEDTPKPVVINPVKPVIEKTIWEIRKGDTLENGLRKWAKKEGLQLFWNVNRSFPITADIKVEGDFDQAVTKLMRAYERAENPVKFEYGIYANGVLSVKLKGAAE